MNVCVILIMMNYRVLLVAIHMVINGAGDFSILKRIIVVDNEGTYLTMFNPELLKVSEPYETEEGCLSLLGGPRKCKRYRVIKVKWQNAQFQTRIQNFSGWTAQIIQHEIDHCNGVLI